MINNDELKHEERYVFRTDTVYYKPLQETSTRLCDILSNRQLVYLPCSPKGDRLWSVESQSAVSDYQHDILSNVIVPVYGLVLALACMAI